MPAFTVEAQQTEDDETQATAPQQDKDDGSLIAILGQDVPLRVPVYPKRDSKDRPLPDGADLRDQYILLDDGSVISMADWVLGALNKSDIDRNLSDLERRLFLGEVARNMLREGRLLGARPGLPIPAPAPLEEELPDRPVGYFGNRLPYLFSSPELETIGNGIQRDYGIHVFNDLIGTSDPAEINGGKTNLIKSEYQRDFERHIAEWQYRGTQLNMLNDFKAKLKREGRSE
jgi:hypothetical protein